MRQPNFNAILLPMGLILTMVLSANVRAGTVAESTLSVSMPEQTSNQPGWMLQLPEEDKVIYKGVVNHDASGPNGSGMLYPASNAGGFLVGLLTHAIILESIKSRQKTAAQEAADKVLVPFTDIVMTYTYRELMLRAVEKITTPRPIQLTPYSERNQSEWLIQSVPIFSLTQDQTALVLDNVISISQPGVPSYVNTIRVVSAANEAPEVVQYWSANQGEKLKAVSAGMVADSLQIALNGATGSLNTDNTAYKTVRYFEGKTEKMERALLLSEQCNRVLIKTLRGWLMSIPVTRTEPAPTLCAGVSANLH